MTQEKTAPAVVAVTISAELFNALGNYLASKPWAEVNHLLVALQESQPVFGEAGVPNPEVVADEVEPADPAKAAKKAATTKR